MRRDLLPLCNLGKQNASSRKILKRMNKGERKRTEGSKNKVREKDRLYARTRNLVPKGYSSKAPRYTYWVPQALSCACQRKTHVPWARNACCPSPSSWTPSPQAQGIESKIETVSSDLRTISGSSRDT